MQQRYKTHSFIQNILIPHANLADNNYESNSHGRDWQNSSPKKRKTESTTSKSESNGTQYDEDDDDPIGLSAATEENGEAGSSTGEVPQKKKRRKEFLNLNATFMAGVPGVTLFSEQVSFSNITLN